jgi:hypothetical protein
MEKPKWWHVNSFTLFMAIVPHAQWQLTSNTQVSC